MDADPDAGAGANADAEANASADAGVDADADVPDVPDVAVAHWGIGSPGGAEAVVVAIAKALGCDTVYTIGPPDPKTRETYESVRFYDVLDDLAFEPLRRLQSRADRLFEYALWEDVDWRAYGDPDVIVTSGATTRAVLTPDDALHVNYCHSPPRWLYDLYHDRTADLPGLFARPLLRYLRLRDSTVDDRVDAYLANSPVIARRLWKFYDRDAEVLYPPIEVDAYGDRGERGAGGDGSGEFYLHVGRLDREKGVRAVVEAFEGLARDLVFVGPRGDAADEVLARVERASNMTYRGFVSAAEKRGLLAAARAVVFNGVTEDFGIVPIEATASGTPTLARDEGFPGMFVDERTGLLHDGSSAGIRETIERFEADPFPVDPAIADPFARERFERRLRAFVADRYRRFDERFDA
jgi:glycosyltransferase involved in cell wall biosynthesis